MITNNICSLLFILVMCILIHKTYSFESNEQEIIDDSILKPYSIKQKHFFDDQHPIIKKSINVKRRSFRKNPHLESAEAYFNWAGKTQRPVEYLRGKRFWLFAKKDEGGQNIDMMSNNLNKQQSSLTQGLWRSGIVGRRR